MNSALFLQIVTTVSDLIIFVFVGFYFWTMQKDKKNISEREKKLLKTQQDIESKYNELIDEAHNEKKKILQSTSQKANAIISDTQFVTDSSRKLIGDALQKLSINLQEKAQNATDQQVDTYKGFLNEASQKSVSNFTQVAQRFALEMDKQTQQFRQQILTNMQKELDEYKIKRIQTAEQNIKVMVDKVAQEVLGKSISKEDHKKLILESLEKAQKEGVFD